MADREELEDVKRVIRATLISNPSRCMTIRDLSDQYKSMEGEEIPFRQFSCGSIYDFLLTIPDTLKLLDQSNRNSYVVPVTNERTEHVARLVRCQNASKKRKRLRSGRERGHSLSISTPDSRWAMSSNRKECEDDRPLQMATQPEGEIRRVLVNRLVKLMRTNKHIWTDSLFSEYQRMYREQLRPEQLGFENEDTFLQHFMNSACNELTFRKIIVDPPPIKLNSAPTEVIDSRRSPYEALPGDVTYDPFPPDVCNGDFNLGTDPSFENLEKGDCFEVNFGEIYTPAKFYITLISKIKVLDNMMADLNKFYECHEEEYKMQISLVSCNLLCACTYSKNAQWHRVRVMSHSLKSAKIFFIDYGTIEIVSTDKLRYLHKDFAKYPPLCVQARLTGIQPKDGDNYSDHVNHEFLHLFGNSDLEAEFVRKTPRCLEIFLYDLTGESKTPVHEELISRNLVQPLQLKVLQKGTGNVSRIIEKIMSKLNITPKPSPEIPISQQSPPVPPKPIQPSMSPDVNFSYPALCEPLHPSPYYIQNNTSLLPPFFPRPTYPFYPIQNLSYPPPQHLYFPKPHYQYPLVARTPSSFHPPPGLSLPSMPPMWSGSNLFNISSVEHARNSPSSTPIVHRTQTTTYSRGNVESMCAKTNPPFSSSTYFSNTVESTCARKSPILCNSPKTAASDQENYYSKSNADTQHNEVEKAKKVEGVYFQPLEVNDKMKKESLEEFPREGLQKVLNSSTTVPKEPEEQIANISAFEEIRKSVREQQALQSKLNEYLGVSEDSEDEEDSALISLCEREAVKNKLNEYFGLNENNENEETLEELEEYFGLNENEEVEENLELEEYFGLNKNKEVEEHLAYLSTSRTPSLTEPNVYANEFNPKTEPKIKSTLIDVKVPNTSVFTSTKKTDAGSLNQLRAFVLQHQIQKECF